MQSRLTGEVGYHEAAKRLNLEGFTTSRPDLDRGSDIIICDQEKCIPAQIKTCFFKKKKEESVATWSGNDNPSFREATDGSALIIIAIDEDYNYKYALVFPSESVPDVKSLKLKRDPYDLGKYYRFVDSWYSLL